MIAIVAALYSLLINGAIAQFDGNPHGWDRKRRCDHFDYTPACGACEGVGGIVWSDNNSDITITECQKVSDTIDPSTLPYKLPRWAPDFFVESHEILIGKNVEGCLNAFPWNDSIGEHCYKPQEVKLWSDMTNKRAVYENGTQHDDGLIGDGNVSFIIMHQGPNMWIINMIPNGSPPPVDVKMVICTQPAEGGDHSKPGVQPIQYNWTQNLHFVAREKIGVEYVWETMTLDHWAFGPHHAWVDPVTGVIVRMWQPFNGLQVFEPGTWSETAPDPKIFADLSTDGSTAPRAARKSTTDANVRLKCTDDGFYSGPSVLGVDDLKRARTKIPRSEYQGDTFEKMTERLNGWLLKHAPKSRGCDEWTVHQLQHLQRMLLELRDPQLDSLYQSTADNRRLRMPADLKNEWAKLNQLASQDPELMRIHRDGHCHEAVMWYVHHLPESVKAEMKGLVPLPLLPPKRHTLANFSADVRAVIRAYEDHVTCQSCHSNVHPELVVV